jgi:hypothetical protein
MSLIHRLGLGFVACFAFGAAVVAQEAASVGSAAPADERMKLAIASARASEGLEAYTGVYVTSAGVELIVVADERSLTIERADGTESLVRLAPDVDRGSFSNASLRIVFAHAADGHVTGLRVVVLGTIGVSAEKAPQRRGKVIIQDVVEKADVPPSVLPELPLPGDLPAWTIPFAVLL